MASRWHPTDTQAGPSAKQKPSSKATEGRAGHCHSGSVIRSLTWGQPQALRREHGTESCLSPGPASPTTQAPSGGRRRSHFCVDTRRPFRAAQVSLPTKHTLRLTLLLSHCWDRTPDTHELGPFGSQLQAAVGWLQAGAGRAGSSSSMEPSRPFGPTQATARWVVPPKSGGPSRAHTQDYAKPMGRLSYHTALIHIRTSPALNSVST